MHNLGVQDKNIYFQETRSKTKSHHKHVFFHYDLTICFLCSHNSVPILHTIKPSLRFL
jgi:hypothetical protein